MYFYTILYLSSIILCFSYFDRHIHIIENKITFFLFMFILLLLAGFRENTGTDYMNYYRIFYNEDLQRQVEPGFQSLIKLTNKIYYNSFYLFTVIIASISIFLKYLYFKNFRYPAIGLLIYVGYFYHNLEYNVIRQGLAISLIYFSIKYIKRKSFLKFLLFILCASLFHISALIFIPAYFIINVKLNIKRIITYTICILIVRILFFNIIINSLLNLLSKVGIDSLSTVVWHIQYYFSDDISKLITIGFIRRIVIITTYILLLNKTNITSITFKIYFCGFILYILFMGNDVFSNRLALNYEICMIPMFANMNFKRTGRSYIMLSVLFFVLYSLLLYTVFTGPRMSYHTFLF
jgi:hypothetical protein